MSPARTKPEDRFAALIDLTDPPDRGDGLAAMVGLANALRATGTGTASAPAGPDPSYRAALRQRLVAVATVQLAADADGAAPAADPTTATTIGKARHRMQWRLAAFAGTFAVAASVGGVGVAAAHSLPGSPFYNVKLATESVQLWTAHGDLAKGRRHLEFARTRLSEIHSLPANSSHIASTLTAMNHETQAGSQELLAAYQSSKSTEPLADLVLFSRQQLAGLTSLTPTLSPALHAQELSSVSTLTTVIRQVRQSAPSSCVLCGTGGILPTPGGGLRILPTPSAPPNPRTGTTHSHHPTTGSSTGSTTHTGGSGTTRKTGHQTPAPNTSATPSPKPSSSGILPIPLPSLPIPLPTLSLPITLPPL